MMNIFDQIAVSAIEQMGVTTTSPYDSYLGAFLLFLFLALTLRIFQRIFLRRLKKAAERTETQIDDTTIEVIQSIRPAFSYFLAFYIAFITLEVTTLAEDVVTTILIIWVVYQAAKSLKIIIRRTIERQSEEADAESQMALRFLGNIGKWALWVLALLLVLSNLGFDITSLVAGLGIGGVAVAFALQNILGDLFSSLAIYLDKPFVPGDFIMIGDHMGTVERVGMKTTRLRSLEGEQITVSNRELTSARVQNYGRLEERRAVLNFSVSYETSTEILEKIPALIQEVIEQTGGVRFYRSHFKEFGSIGPTIEAAYYVLSKDYVVYMDIQQKINIEVKKRLDELGVAFVSPFSAFYNSSND